jgi:hypothetical protein
MRDAGGLCEGTLCGVTACEGDACGDRMERMGKALHDLCQPLTTLQCQLEMAKMLGTAEAYREAAELGLAECVRLSEAVGSMRAIVRAARKEGAGDPPRLRP